MTFLSILIGFGILIYIFTKYDDRVNEIEEKRQAYLAKLLRERE